MALIAIPSRRDVLRGLTGAGLGLGLSRLPASVGAKKKRRRKKPEKKPKPNRFGCLEVGDPCKRADQCCSGICKKKKCRAHDTGTCKQDGPEICVIDPPPALTCNNDATCRCFRTTAGSIVCAQFINNELNCIDCARDDDCVAEGFPPGTVCAPLSTGICAGQCEGGIACLIPCGAGLHE
jgi:hypothetical protein